ncbi:MAG: signal peptidase II, partial [Dehalococcoidia bacterium]
MKRWWIFLLIAVVVVVLDQISKSWIRSHLALGESFPEIGRLLIIHLQNTGSAFGLFTGQGFLLTIIALVGLVVILMFFRYLSQSSPLGTIALGLVFGGAIGNLTDRLRIGAVTDFIYIRLWNDFYWPAFNVADSALSVGIIALLIFIIMG